MNKLLSIWKKYKDLGNEFYINDNQIFIINSWDFTTYSFTEDEIPKRVTEQRMNDYLVRKNNLRVDWSGLGFRVYEDIEQDKKGKWLKTIKVKEFSSKEIINKLKQIQTIIHSSQKRVIDLPKRVISIIKNSITEYSPTHIEILPTENKKMKIRIFDIKRYVQQEFDNFGYADLDLNTDFDFHFSIRVEPFSKLPSTDLTLAILDNDIISFSNDEIEIYIQQQELSTPIIEFDTTTHERITLLFQPTTVPT